MLRKVFILSSDGEDCQSISQELEIVFDALPEVNITSSSTSLCRGDPEAILSGTPAGGTYIHINDDSVIRPVFNYEISQ